jgi:hypothetical protein
VDAEVFEEARKPDRLLGMAIILITFCLASVWPCLSELNEPHILHFHMPQAEMGMTKQNTTTVPRVITNHITKDTDELNFTERLREYVRRV